jgi:hypothetical protein
MWYFIVMNSLSMKEMILNHRYRDSSVSVATSYRLDSQGSIPGKGRRFFPSPVSRPALGHTQPFVQWVLGFLSLGVKQPGCEADHLPPSSAEDENGVDLLPVPHMSSWHIAYLIKHKDIFTFWIITLIFNLHCLGIGVLVSGYWAGG